MRLFVVWVINALALLLVAYLLKGIHVNGSDFVLIAALMLGLANALIRPILVTLTLSVTLLTPGLFILIINVLLFLFIDNLLAGFQVTSFGVALLGPILYNVISWLFLGLLLYET